MAVHTNTANSSGAFHVKDDYPINMKKYRVKYPLFSTFDLSPATLSLDADLYCKTVLYTLN